MPHTIQCFVFSSSEMILVNKLKGKFSVVLSVMMSTINRWPVHVSEN